MGYINLEQLRTIKRLEQDVEIEGMGTFRVQALMGDELREVREASERTGGERDNILFMKHSLALGLVEPDLARMVDRDEALDLAGRLPLVVQDELSGVVAALTGEKPGAAYRALFNGAASAKVAAATTRTPSI